MAGLKDMVVLPRFGRHPSLTRDFAYFSHICIPYDPLILGLLYSCVSFHSFKVIPARHCVSPSSSGGSQALLARQHALRHFGGSGFALTKLCT